MKAMFLSPALLLFAVLQQTPQDVPKTAVSAKLDPLVQQVLDKANDLRKKEGLTAVKINPELMKAAEWMAKDMATNLYFSHKDKQGRSYKQRADAFGYLGWNWVGENIGSGQRKPDDVIKDWLTSPAHKATLLKAEARDAGIAVATSKDSKKIYWVLTFGSR